MDEVNPKTWKKNVGSLSSLVYVFSSSSKALWSSNLSWTRFREFSPPGFRTKEILEQELKPFKMDVSENSGTPKSSILIGFSIINHPFWGTPIFGNTQMGGLKTEVAQNTQVQGGPCKTRYK